MKHPVVMAALKWGLTVAAAVVMLDLLTLLWPGRSMFGFHPIHFIWLMLLGEWIEPILRPLPAGWHGFPIATFSYIAVGTGFFGMLGAFMGGFSKAAALTVEARRARSC